MAYNYEYPYTDPNRYNSDWILNRVKELSLEWIETQKEWNNTREEFASLKAFIQNYFAQLDLQDEVNVKLDIMARDGSLSALISPLFSEYKKEIDRSMSEQNDKINVLNSRMDTFTSLPDGSTAGDAELQDIRIGYNGKVYPSAGDAVRMQVSGIKEDLSQLSGEIVNLEHTYFENFDFEIIVGCFSKVNWRFYYTDWAIGYNFARFDVEPGQEYKISGSGNGNAQAVMFFSGEPSQTTYVSGVGEGDTNQTYINYEIEVPQNARIMIVQSMPHLTQVAVTKKLSYTMTQELEGKMYWEVEDGILKVVSKYKNDTDLIVKFGKRGPNSLPDFISFSTCPNENKIASNGENFTEFIGNITDWHSPFQVRAVDNADGDKGTNYNFTGGNHNYNNGSAIGDGLATARCGNMTVIIDGCETVKGSGYSDNIKVVWENYVQGNNTIKADGTGREILKEVHELIINNGIFDSSGYIEALENIHIDSYYGYQIYGLNLNTAFNHSISFIGGSNRKEITDISVANESGNADCVGIIVKGSEHTCRLTLDTSYDLGKRDLYEGTKGCYNTQYQKAYTNLIANASVVESGNRYYSKARWEFFHSEYI